MQASLAHASETRNSPHPCNLAIAGAPVAVTAGADTPLVVNAGPGDPSPAIFESASRVEIDQRPELRGKRASISRLESRLKLETRTRPAGARDCARWTWSVRTWETPSPALSTCRCVQRVPGARIAAAVSLSSHRRAVAGRADHGHSHPSDGPKLRGTQHVVMICRLSRAIDAIEAVARRTVYRDFCGIDSVNGSHVRFR
jgi:hypothetical protein